MATTVVASLDDEAMVDHIFAEQGDDVAAVVIEPMPANNGLLVQRESFLSTFAPAATSMEPADLRRVITGFRFAKVASRGTLG